MFETATPLAYIVVLPLLTLFASAVSTLLARDERHASVAHPNALEGLRGVLAITVFFHHAAMSHTYLRTGRWEAPTQFYAELGPAAVSLFFFITGFLFWSKAIRARRISLAPFLANRARRLMPAYLASLGAVIVIVALESHLRRAVSAGELATELLKWLACGVPSGFSTINAVSHTWLINAGVFWTLRIEWAFYLALPALAWFATRARLPLLLGACAALLPAVHRFWDAQTLAARGLDLPVELAFYVARCFSVGMMVAHLRAHVRDLPWLRSVSFTVGAMGLVGVALFLPPATFGFTKSLLLAPAFTAVVFDNDLFGALRARGVRHLGAVSYSVYLLHGIVLYLVTRRLGSFLGAEHLSAPGYWCLMGATGCVVILVATASYWWFELPFIVQRQTVPATATAASTT